MERRGGNVVQSSPSNTPRSVDKSSRDIRPAEGNMNGKHDKEKGVNVQVMVRCRVHWFQKIPNGMYQYFIKVVPTVYTPLRGAVIRSNQFSVTEYYKDPDNSKRAPPGVFFYYDLSAIEVNFTETHTSFLHFLTNICAIVGGIFTVAGILDSFIYHGHMALRKKREIGKLG